MERQNEEIRLKTAVALAIVQNKPPGVLYKDYIKDIILESVDPSEYWRMRYNGASKELFDLKARLFDLEMSPVLPDQPNDKEPKIVQGNPQNNVYLTFSLCRKLENINPGKTKMSSGLKYAINNILYDTHNKPTSDVLLKSNLLIIKTIETHLQNRHSVSQPYFGLLLDCLLKYITESSYRDHDKQNKMFDKFLDWVKISCDTDCIHFSDESGYYGNVAESVLSLCLKLAQTNLEFRVTSMGRILNSFVEYEKLRKSISMTGFGEVFSNMEMIIESLFYYASLIHHILDFTDSKLHPRIVEKLIILVADHEGKIQGLACSQDQRIKKVGLSLFWKLSQTLDFLKKFI